MHHLSSLKVVLTLLSLHHLPKGVKDLLHFVGHLKPQLSSGVLMIDGVMVIKLVHHQSHNPGTSPTPPGPVPHTLRDRSRTSSGTSPTPSPTNS